VKDISTIDGFYIKWLIRNICQQVIDLWHKKALDIYPGL
jgi:hypothetical protein